MAVLEVQIDDHFDTAEGAAERFKNTPAFLPGVIRNGASAHIGDGVFLSRCHFCMKTHLSYGPIPEYAGIGQHEYNDHGASVPGIDLAILA